jgi:rod shape-determining protein MreB
LGGVVLSTSIRCAGDKFDQAITEYMRSTHKLAIGETTAERMKKEIGSACPPDDGEGESMHVKGRDLITGLPKEINISQRQIAEALAELIAQIIDTIKRALEQTPAELAADIVERGIMLTGGGCLLGNLDKVLRRSTSLPISIAEDPLLCVVMGTGKALEERSKLSDIFETD